MRERGHRPWLRRRSIPRALYLIHGIIVCAILFASLYHAINGVLNAKPKAIPIGREFPPLDRRDVLDTSNYAKWRYEPALAYAISSRAHGANLTAVSCPGAGMISSSPPRGLAGAADGGYQPAQALLGEILRAGKSLPQDCPRSFNCLSSAVRLYPLLHEDIPRKKAARSSSKAPPPPSPSLRPGLRPHQAGHAQSPSLRRPVRPFRAAAE